MQARAFVPGLWPLQNRHERLRPAVQLDAARIARYAATRCSSPGISNSCRGVQPGPRARCLDAPGRGDRGRSRDRGRRRYRVPSMSRAAPDSASDQGVASKSRPDARDNQYEDGRFADFMDLRTGRRGGSSAGPTRRRATTTTTSRGARVLQLLRSGRIAAQAACTA